MFLDSDKLNQDFNANCKGKTKCDFNPIQYVKYKHAHDNSTIKKEKTIASTDKIDKWLLE